MVHRQDSRGAELSRPDAAARHLAKSLLRRGQKKRRSPVRPVLLYGVTVPQTAAVLLRGQLAYMREAGWDVHVATSPGRGTDIVKGRESVTVHELPMTREISPGADLRALRDWWRLIGELRPAVTNVSTPKAALLGSLAALARRVPRRVYLVRGLRLESERGLRRLILWTMERITILASTDVLVVSPSLRDELVFARLAKPGRLGMIGSGSSNGVQAEEIIRAVAEVDRESIRRRLGIPSGAFVVSFIGRLAADKGINDLVDALARPECARVHLVTLGDTEDKSVLERLGVLGTRWHSQPWSDDVSPTLAVSDALCLPTYREGYPNVVLEASAAALPVVTTEATGARDSVVNGQTGFIVGIRDSEALAGRLLDLADSPVLRADLGRAGQKRVLTEYQPQQLWRELDLLYKQPQSSARRPSPHGPGPRRMPSLRETPQD